MLSAGILMAGVAVAAMWVLWESQMESPLAKGRGMKFLFVTVLFVAGVTGIPDRPVTLTTKSLIQYAALLALVVIAGRLHFLSLAARGRGHLAGERQNVPLDSAQSTSPPHGAPRKSGAAAPPPKREERLRKRVERYRSSLSRKALV
jgi:hypothetical protein